VQDKVTSVSKGYGFINCENKKTYERILGIKTHRIRDRMVEINHAIKRNGEVPEDIKFKALRKLFVGGLTLETTREVLVNHFSQFGMVVNAYVIYDPITKQSKNFGYVEFARPEDAIAAANCNEHIINGKKASIQFFKTKETQKKVQTVQDPIEIPEIPYCHQGLNYGRIPFGQQGILSQKQGGEYSTSNLYDNQHPYYSQSFTQEYLQADFNAQKRSFIVQPQREPSVFSSSNRCFDFYLSLKRADQARHFQGTYTKENLRFNRLRIHN
jgi:RNA recognition motif-containing protein